MIKLQVSNNVDPDVWNSHTIMLGGTCFHTYEYSLFDAEIYGSQPLYFSARDEGGELKALAVGRMRTKAFGGVSLFKSLSFGSLPACHDDKTRNAMLTDILEYACSQGIMFLSINSFSTPFDMKIINELGFNVKKRWEFVLSLDQTKEKLWEKISPKKRNKIRKAEKKNLLIKEVTDLSDVLELRGLELETQKRKTERGIPYPVAGESYFISLKNKLIDKGIGRLYFAYDNGLNCVAGAFFGVFNKTVYYMLSSANVDGLKLAAPDAILWECIKDHLSRGYLLFNLGGISESELFGQPVEKTGLYVFKKSFASTPKPCYSGSLILRSFVYCLFRFLKQIKGMI